MAEAVDSLLAGRSRMDDKVGSYERVGTLPEPVSVSRRRRFPWAIAILVLVVAVGAALAWRLFFVPREHARSARTALNDAQPVGVATIDRGDIRVNLNGLGTVTPLATVTVKTQIAGQIMSIPFTEGQHVRKGDSLIQIDPRPYQVALEQGEAQLAHDQALLKDAQIDLVRYQTLYKQDSIAEQQVDTQTYLVKQYEAQVKVDQATIDTAKLNLTYCHIVSPVDGTVGLRQVDIGNYVQPSDTTGLVVVTQLQPISVIFSLAEDSLPAVMKQVHAGAKLLAVAYDRSNATKIATGTLAAVDNEVDTTTGMVKLRAMFDNDDESLFPSQFVNIQLLLDTKHNVVRAPVAAIQTGSPGTFVYLVNADGTVSVRKVAEGRTDGQMVELASGLDAGDRVVVDGADRLRDGAKVTIPQPGGAAAPGAAGARAAGTGSASGGTQKP